MCASSRYLLIGGLAGVAVSSLTGSDLVGLLAALAAGLLVFAAGRRFPGRFGATSCATPDRTGLATDEIADADHPTAEVSARG